MGNVTISVMGSVMGVRELASAIARETQSLEYFGTLATPLPHSDLKSNLH